MENFNNTFYTDRLAKIKEDLLIGDENHLGGNGLKDMLIHCLISDNDLEIESLFSSITQLYREKERRISNGGIMTVKDFERYYKPKEHMVYPCLDNDLRFVMLHYGEDDWNDAFYVFSELNANTAWNIKEKKL